MAIQVGESVGHYQVVEEIGAGGNGRVLKVQHLITRRREAMKILANGRPTSQEYAHRVLREIRLQASLDHPNIAAVLNAFWLEDDLVMIMELIDGVSLAQIIEQRRLPIEHALMIIRQVLLGLDHAHQHGVIHRDVSTANIIVAENYRVKLTDFGLAKGAADLNSTETGGMIGSPYYISPEQVRSANAADQRSDVYSTGIVLYELLTGSRPFEADSTFLLMQAHVQMRPQPAIERNAAIPQYINEAVMRAIAKKPADRFQSASEFLAALDGTLMPPPVSVSLPVKETLPPPTPVIATPVASHTYAVTIESAVESAAIAKSAPVWWKQALRHPATGLILGLGVVAAAVVPFLLYDFVAERPRFQPAVGPLPVVEVPVPAPPKSVEALTSGPRELPTLPQGDAGLRVGRRIARQPLAEKSKPAPAPVVIWGEAKTPAANVARPPEASPAAPVETPGQQSVAASPEEPPVLDPSPVAPVVETALPKTGDTIRRKGLLGRLAGGLKAINPLRKDRPAAESPLIPKKND
jgi:serine/threonine-protein kinase